MRFSGFIARLTGILTVLNLGIGSLALLPSAVIVPLYIYPGTDCVSWAPLVTAIPAFPLIEFIVVINPSSGPGPAGSQPDANYQTCVARLRSLGSGFENVKIIGYVATGFGKRSLADITKDIDTYAGWNEAYLPEGIFFDEAVTDPKFVPDYQSYASYGRMKLGSDAHITLNPGTWSSSFSSPEYFTFSDVIVTYEDFYKNFNISRFPTDASTPTSKQAAIIHTGPMTMPLSAPMGTVEVITQELGLAASFYTTLPNSEAYHQFSTAWMGYLREVELTQMDG